MTFQNKAILKSMTVVSSEDINWDSVVNNELPRLYNYFRYRLGDELVAEELTSVVLEKAWTKRQRYRKDRAAFATWLFAIAKKEVLMYLRKRRVTLPISMAEAVTGDTTEDMVQHTQDIRQLSYLLTNLPEREREILALKYGADLNNREIAVVMELSESNVGTILNRVLQRLRGQWKVQDE
jgi:RNA polymerase sigma-70 factor, ECF subfamily